MADVLMSALLADGGKIIVQGERECRIFGWIDTMHTANGTDLKPGYLVTEVGETFPDLDLVANGEAPYGLLLEDPTGEHSDDIDDAWDDNYAVRVLKFPSPIEAWVMNHDNAGAAWVRGTPTTVSGEEAGTCSDETSDIVIDFVGRYARPHAAGSADLLPTILRFC